MGRRWSWAFAIIFLKKNENLRNTSRKNHQKNFKSRFLKIGNLWKNLKYCSKIFWLEWMKVKPLNWRNYHLQSQKNLFILEKYENKLPEISMKIWENFFSDFQTLWTNFFFGDRSRLPVIWNLNYVRDFFFLQRIFNSLLGSTKIFNTKLFTWKKIQFDQSSPFPKEFLRII